MQAMKVVIIDIDRDITLDLGDKPVDELTLLPDHENTDPDNLPCVYIKGVVIVNTAKIGTRWRFMDGCPPTVISTTIYRQLGREAIEDMG